MIERYEIFFSQKFIFMLAKRCTRPLYTQHFQATIFPEFNYSDRNYYIVQ